MVSGWISLRKNLQPGLFGDAGFALSDHADFQGLITAVKTTGAEKVITMHGYAAEFAKSLNNLGIQSVAISRFYNYGLT